VDESDTQPASIIFYSNLPIACQQVVVVGVTNYPINCWVKFQISSSDDIAVRQRVPYPPYFAPKTACTYQLQEKDWKPVEGYAYDSERSFDIVAKVNYPRNGAPV